MREKKSIVICMFKIKYFLKSSRTFAALNSSQCASRDKGSGPPIYGLFDTVHSPSASMDNQSNDIQNYVSYVSFFFYKNYES